MKASLVTLAVALAAGLGVIAFAQQATATSAHQTIKVQIRHQTRGCHSWAVGTHAYAAHIVARIHVGDQLWFKNTDVMPHRLVKTQGPAVSFVGKRLMSHMGAAVMATFTHTGVYSFKTVAGEDYMKGIKTVGEDNLLTLRVVVS